MLRSRVALASASALWRSCSCRSFCGTEHGTTRCFLSRCVNNWSLRLEKNVEQFLNLYILLTELKWFLMIFRLTFPQKSYKIKTLPRYICCGLGIQFDTRHCMVWILCINLFVTCNSYSAVEIHILFKYVLALHTTQCYFPAKLHMHGYWLKKEKEMFN